jgi:hypothetical protein
VKGVVLLSPLRWPQGGHGDEHDAINCSPPRTSENPPSRDCLETPRHGPNALP